MNEPPPRVSLLSRSPMPVPGGNSFQQPCSSRKPESVCLWPNLPVQLGNLPYGCSKALLNSSYSRVKGKPRNLSGLLLSPLWEGQHRCRGWVTNLWSEPSAAVRRQVWKIGWSWEYVQTLQCLSLGGGKEAGRVGTGRQDHELRLQMGLSVDCASISPRLSKLQSPWLQHGTRPGTLTEMPQTGWTACQAGTGNRHKGSPQCMGGPVSS